MSLVQDDGSTSSSSSDLSIVNTTVVTTELRWFDHYRWAINTGSLVIYIMVGTLAVQHFEQWDCLTSLYVITQIITTIGYGDVVVTKASSQWFMIFYVLAGTMIIANILNSYLERTLSVAIEVMRARLRWLEAYHMESIVDVKAAKERCGNTNALMVAAMFYLLFLFGGMLFYAIVESCSCSYGPTKIHDCEPDQCEVNGKTKNLREALYMSVITLSTTGFGDYSPQSKMGRAFGIVWMTAGVVSYVNLVGQALIWWHEMKKAARVHRLHVHPDLFEEIDHNGDGKLTRSEFRLYFLMKSGVVKEQDIRHIDSFFDILDLDKSGRLYKSELDTALKRDRTTMQY